MFKRYPDNVKYATYLSQTSMSSKVIVWHRQTLKGMEDITTVIEQGNRRHQTSPPVSPPGELALTQRHAFGWPIGSIMRKYDIS